MPLYEFQCDSCGLTMEVMKSFSDPPPAACERCGSPVRKLLSAPAFQFKGTGWYVSDYGRPHATGRSEEGGGANGSARKSADSGSGASGPGGAAPTDSKDAGKPDASPAPGPKAD